MTGSSALARSGERDALLGRREGGDLRRGGRADAGGRHGKQRAGKGHGGRASGFDWATLEGRRLLRRGGEGRLATSGTAWRLKRTEERPIGSVDDGRRGRAEGQVEPWRCWPYTGGAGRWPTTAVVWMDKSWYLVVFLFFLFLIISFHVLGHCYRLCWEEFYFKNYSFSFSKTTSAN